MNEQWIFDHLLNNTKLKIADGEIHSAHAEPKPDIACCSECGWQGDVSACKTGREGDRESGYIDVHLCPKCPDGGCIDDYDMSPQRAITWAAWRAKTHET